MTLQSRIIIFAAFAGVLALLGGIVYYASLDNVHLEQIEIKLANVELKEVDTKNNQAKFNVTFLIKNPSDKAFTVSQIEYQLYGDGILLGSGQYSTVDISMPGRATFLPGVELHLKNIFVLEKSEVNSEIYQDAIENRITSFSVEGNLTAETSWSIIEKDFKAEF